MKLLQYLKEEVDPALPMAEKIRAFAEQIDEPETAVRKWVYRQRHPHLAAVVKIEAATGGKVKVPDLVLEAA